MQENKLVIIFRKAKIIQLCILLAIEVFFIGILIANPAMTRRIYEDRTLYLLCAALWVLMIFALLSLIYDFCKLRSFAQKDWVPDRESYPDDLNSRPNRHGMDAIFQTYDTPESIADAGCCMAAIDNLEAANQSGNRQVKDHMIQDFSSILESVGEFYGTVGRIDSNEFLVVIGNCNQETMERFIGDLEGRIASYNRENEHFPLHFQSTYILNSEERMEAFTQLLTATYNRLHNK